MSSPGKYGYTGKTSNNRNYYQISFSASGSVTTSSETRPINISAIPLIVAK